MNHGLDTDTQVFFYEQDFYVLSNFSAFNLKWKQFTYPTSEHAYQCEKFDQGDGSSSLLRSDIRNAPSAHEAFKIAEQHRTARRPDWDAVKVDVMRNILRAKAEQHEYVRRKLLQTGDRELVENSWRDSFWGWGPNRDGQNTLGKLWMEIRAGLTAGLKDGCLCRVTDGQQKGALVYFHFINCSGHADCRFAEPFEGISAGEIVVVPVGYLQSCA